MLLIILYLNKIWHLLLTLKEKVVLVTGVSSGIGLGVAREFARAGADVAGCSRKAANDESIVTYVEAVESEGSRGLYVQADVTKEQDLEQLVRKVIDTFGRLDILVSNAGMNVLRAQNIVMKSIGDIILI